jgi:hypothetical protein
MIVKSTVTTLLFFITMLGALQAQELSSIGKDSLLHVTRDPRIDKLVQAHIKQNQKSPRIEGYRVQVYSGSGNEARQQANDIRRQLIASNPEMPTHLVYQPPNFKVRIGDCRSEFEAIRLKRELAFHYPQGFVVRDIIELPRLAIDASVNPQESGVFEDVEMREGALPELD